MKVINLLIRSGGRRYICVCVFAESCDDVLSRTRAYSVVISVKSLFPKSCRYEVHRCVN